MGWWNNEAVEAVGLLYRNSLWNVSIVWDRMIQTACIAGEGWVGGKEGGLGGVDEGRFCGSEGLGL